MKRNVLYLLVAALVVSLTAFGCGSSSSDDAAPATTNPTTKSGWLAAVTDAEWTTAVTNTVTLTMVEGSSSYSFSPSALTFTAGEAYVLKVINTLGNGEKHYFATSGAAAGVVDGGGDGGNFYQAIATRKVQTTDAEYKAPYFTAVEMLIPSAEVKELEIYFVAVLPGVYNFYCSIGTHEANGMLGTITIVAASGSTASDYTLDLEVASDYDTDLASDARLSGSNAVWDDGTRVDITSSFTETSSTDYSFTSSFTSLTTGIGYKLTITNPDGNGKHYWYDEGDVTGVGSANTDELFQTVAFRKAQDSQAEIKPYYLTAVELRGTSGSALSTDLYFVPTVAGTYDHVCTVTGHEDLGMHETITVE